MLTSKKDYEAFWSDTYREKIKNITFEDKINVPGNAIESWDISVGQNGKVMSYIVPNQNDSSYYDLYIQSDTQLYANFNMSAWFKGFVNIDSINSLELLDTSYTNDMSYMFNNTGANSTTFTLDVSNFDTSSVTDMRGMFSYTGMHSTTLVLDLSNFDTSSVTNMNFMFAHAGLYSTTFSLDISNFDTSNVTDMNTMFWYTGANSTTFTMDLSNFDTSSVTDMTWMLMGAGSDSAQFVTTITIRNPNIIAYADMFYGVATKSGSKITVNYTSETEALVEQMIATKSSNSNVVKGVQVD